MLLSCVLFFDALLPVPTSWQTLLIADAFIFPSMYLVEALLSSVVYQQLLPDDRCLNASTVGMVWIVMVQIGRFLGPPITRMMIAKHGLTGYGTIQLFIVIIMASIFEVGVAPSRRDPSPPPTHHSEDPENVPETTSAIKANLMEEHKIIILTNGYWTQEFFVKLVLPNSRYSDSVSSIVFFNISDGPFEQHLKKLEALLREFGSSRCYATGDAGMKLYALAAERLKGEMYQNGACFSAFMLCDNKLACHSLIAGCSGIRTQGVTVEQVLLPDMGGPSFFKPLTGTGATDTFRYEGKSCNPFFGVREKYLQEPLVQEQIDKDEELRICMSGNFVGLVQVYVDPADRKIVSADGFVCNGKIYHYVLSDNMYVPDEPERFLCLVTPSQQLTDPEADRVWELYDKVVGDLVSRGLDNQFVDIEFFVLPSAVEVMEVNPRTFGNQIPIFSMLFGADCCMFSIALDLLAGDLPKLVTPLDCQGLVGVCYYAEPVQGEDSIVEHADKDVIYYPGPYDDAHHVYAIGRTYDSALQKCVEFHAALTSKKKL